MFSLQIHSQYESTNRINKLIINTTYSIYYIIGHTFVMINYLLH